MRIVIGVTGATGVQMSMNLLKALQNVEEVETHLVITRSAEVTWREECPGLSLSQMKSLADFIYDPEDMAARISSGTFRTDGMIVLPCSVKSLAGIASGYADNLVLRAVDVSLKEGRKVVLVPRETPLSKIHLRNLLTCAEAGCTILPPMLSFYNGPVTIEDEIDHVIGKILMQFGIRYEKFKPWGEKR
jgi:flavin prenyltransferase